MIQSLPYAAVMQGCPEEGTVMLGAEGGKEPALATGTLYLVTRLGATCALFIPVSSVWLGSWHIWLLLYKYVLNE